MEDTVTSNSEQKKFPCISCGTLLSYLTDSTLDGGLFFHASGQYGSAFDCFDETNYGSGSGELRIAVCDSCLISKGKENQVKVRVTERQVTQTTVNLDVNQIFGETTLS